MAISSQKFDSIFRLLPVVLLVFANIFIFSTFDIFRGTPSEYEAGYLDMLLLLMSWGAPIVVLLLLPGLIFSKANLTRYTSFLLMLGILTWFQAGTLLWDYGVFDGRSTDWEKYDLLGWFDAGLWFCLLVASLRYANRLIPFAAVLAWILICGQAVILASQGGLRGADWLKEYGASLGLPDEILQLSSQQNIVHIILDSMQSDVFLELAEKDGLFNEFTGFTLFYENSAVTPHTSLAIPAIFSGKTFDGSQSPATYYKSAMAEGFQNSLHDAGFTVNLIPQLSMQDSQFTNYYKVPSTYQGTVEDLKNQNAAQLLDIALFRNAPHFLRKAIYAGGDWFLLPMVRGDMQARSFQEKAFFNDYTEGLESGDDSPAYHFIHLTPPHPPYTTLSDGSYAGRVLPNTRENYVNESRAIIKLIVQYIRKLKSLGVYDDATVILQGDHGSQINPQLDGKPVQTCVSRMAALLAVKPSQSSGLMKVSNAPSNLLDVAPTILSVVNDNVQTVFDVDEFIPRERPLVVFDGKGETAKILTYSINGSVYDPDSCKSAKSREVHSETERFETGTEVQFGMIGSSDSFMGAGWAPCQADYCWTVGNFADINLPIDKISTDLMLRARFKPYFNELKAHRQRIGVSVNGTRLGEWSVSRFGFQNASVRIPAALVEGESLQVRFHFPDAVSPRDLGLGGDTRLLGMALQTLRIDMQSNYDLGSDIAFGKTGNAVSFMGIGWSPCGEDFCWTADKSAELYLPIQEIDSELELQMLFKPFTHATKVPQQRIAVLVNGKPLAEWSASSFEFETTSVRIPAELISEDLLHVSFQLPDAVSPESLGLSTDSRLLGIAVRNVRVKKPGGD